MAAEDFIFLTSILTLLTVILLAWIGRNIKQMTTNAYWQTELQNKQTHIQNNIYLSMIKQQFKEPIDIIKSPETSRDAKEIVQALPALKENNEQDLKLSKHSSWLESSS